MTNDYKGAISDYLEAIDLNSEFIDPYIGLGIIYSIQNEIDAAIEITEKALEINAEETGLIINLAYFYMENGNYDKAVEKFNSILQIVSGNLLVDATLGISMAYYKMNNKPKSEQYFDQALKLKTE